MRFGRDGGKEKPGPSAKHLLLCFMGEMKTYSF